MKQETPDAGDEGKALDAMLHVDLNKSNAESTPDTRDEMTDIRPVEVTNLLDSVGTLMEHTPEEGTVQKVNKIDHASQMAKKVDGKKRKGLKRQSTVML